MKRWGEMMKERQDPVKDQGCEPLEREGRKGNECLCGKTYVGSLGKDLGPKW